ncbi:MAG: type II secretion system protein GspM [Desulfobacterota bacterium]|nr:type II secretion system protein GspM [Thermodesulfobacteriota bacterium]
MKLKPRERTFLIVGAVAVAVFVVLRFGLFPLYDTIVEQRRDLALKKAAREKYRAFLKEYGDKKNQLQKPREEGMLQKSLLRGETPSLAAADIQKIIDGFAKESKIDVQSVKVMDPEPKDGFLAVPVQIIFSSDMSRLKKFIQSIETDRKLLTIPELKIRVKNEIRDQGITVTMQVAGFMKKDEQQK